MNEVPTEPAPDKRMKLRYAGSCRLCGTELPARIEAVYERATKTVRCVECPAGDAAPVEAVNDTEPRNSPVPTSNPDGDDTLKSVAGASARREYKRRRLKDEQGVRERWGRLAPVALFLRDEKQTTAAWDRGAVGEEALGASLDKLESESWRTLHDRLMPRSRANIDHLVITPSGVWVIDAKRYKGRPELKVEGGILRPVTKRLVIAGRDGTRLVDGVKRQVAAVRGVVGESVPVVGVLCFIDADWPLIGGAIQIDGVHALWPKATRAMMLKASSCDVDVAEVHRLLAHAFPQA